MAVKLIGYADETGLTTAKFVRKRKSDGAYWSTVGAAFEAYNAANIANYGIAATETGAMGCYTATDPAEGTEGDFLLVKAAGASLAVSDLISGKRWQDLVQGAAEIRAAIGMGSANLDSQISSQFAATNATLGTIITRVQALRLRRNVALAAFPFKLVSSTDHATAVTGATVTATRSLDGAAFGACANSASEIGGGMYAINLAAGDLNGDTVTLRFAATGADTREITIITQGT